MKNPNQTAHTVRSISVLFAIPSASFACSLFHQFKVSNSNCLKCQNIHDHYDTFHKLPSKSASPTPTIMIDIGNLAA